LALAGVSWISYLRLARLKLRRFDGDVPAGFVLLANWPVSAKTLA
jgi:hypothetical protein